MSEQDIVMGYPVGFDPSRGGFWFQIDGRSDRVFVTIDSLHGELDQETGERRRDKNGRNPIGTKLYERLQNALDGKGGRFTPMRLRVIETAPNQMQVLTISHEPTRDERAARDTLGRRFEWSDSLTRAVERDADYLYQGAAFKFIGTLRDDKDPDHLALHEALQARYLAAIERECEKRGITGEQLKAYGVDPRVASADLLAADEGGRSVRYELREEFDLQAAHCQTPKERIEGLFNYIRQREIVEMFTDENLDLGLSRQNELIGSGALEATNPLMGDDEHRFVGQQLGRLIGAQTLAGFYDVAGAEPAHPEVDQIEHQKKDPDRSVHCRLKNAIDKTGHHASKSEREMAYLKLGTRQLKECNVCTEYAVKVEQANLVEAVKPPPGELKTSGQSSTAFDFLKTATKTFQSIVQEL